MNPEYRCDAILNCGDMELAFNAEASKLPDCATDGATIPGR